MTAAKPADVAADVERALRAVANPDRAEHEKRYLESTLVHLGASVPAIRRVAIAAARANPGLDRAALLAAADALWARGIHECRMAAVELLDARSGLLREDDLAGVVERFLREARTWAIVDGLAANVAGALVERFPRLAATLDRWAADPDFWIRRASLLAELVALREGRSDLARFGRRAEPMLAETEFFIRKAIGWVLRDASRRNPDAVARWLLPRAARASPLTLREATKHLAPRQRDEILRAAGGGASRPRRGAGPSPARRSKAAPRPRRARSGRGSSRSG